MSQKNHYATLGLASSASLSEIKKAFRQLAAQYHPDRNHSPEAPLRFRAVQEAYDVLSNSETRHDYDKNRQRNLLDDPLAEARQIWRAHLADLR